MWIKHRREEIGLTQEELASKLNVSRAAVSHWESGRNAPQMDDSAFVQTLADALKLDANSILKLAGFEVDSEHSEYAVKVAAIIDKLPESKQRQILHIVQTFLED